MAIDGYQLSYGAYLGFSWVIAAIGGVAAAVALSAAALIGKRRHTPAARWAVTAWLVLGVASSSAVGFPFPRPPYAGVAVLNVVHAVLLGYEAVTCAALLALFAYGVRRSRAAKQHFTSLGCGPRGGLQHVRNLFPGDAELLEECPVPFRYADDH